MFVDQVKIYVRAGKGGNGVNSFYRDKFNRRGTPDGGDGGRGGNVIIKTSSNLTTLMDFRYRNRFCAPDGRHGSGKKKRGKDGVDLVIKVPLGTTVKDSITGCILRDLDAEGCSVIVARAGKGGLGNAHRQPATEGESGQERQVTLDLKLIADIGIVGLPNAGKSTLISKISSAHPKIAAYPFTTRAPNLGVVQTEDFSFIAADIPGLISGSYRGKGLGDRFLRHIERTKLLLHLIDMAAAEARDPVEDFESINKELEFYSTEVGKKEQILVANKMDLEGAAENLNRFKARIRKKIYPISALKGQGLEELVEAIGKRLQKNCS
jgi:GTP-binding protein